LNSLVSSYLRKDNLNSFVQKKQFFKLIQLLSFLRTLEYSRQFIDDQAYCVIEFAVLDFIGFTGGYMNEMVETEITKNQQEKLNLEIFKQTAREQGIDVSEVRGTGLMREFVPDFMQKDICERPKQDSRPNSWEDPTYSDNDPSYFN